MSHDTSHHMMRHETIHNYHLYFTNLKQQGSLEKQHTSRLWQSFPNKEESVCNTTFLNEQVIKKSSWPQDSSNPAQTPSLVVDLVPLKGGIGSIWGPPEGKDYKWYISGIYCQLGDYMLPIPPFRGTRNNH